MQMKLGKTMSTKRVLLELLATYNETSAAIGYAMANQYERNEIEQLRAAQEVAAELLRNFGFRSGIDYEDVIREGNAYGGKTFAYWHREAVAR